jgi:hypothetical protein
MNDFGKILSGHDLLGEISGASRRERIALNRSKYRTARQRREGLRMLAATVIADLGLAWSLMITVGIAHRGWWHQVPPMGFGTAVAVVIWLLTPLVVIAIAVQALRS